MTSALLLRSGLLAVTREIDPPPDLLDALAAPGFVWLHDGTGLVASGVVTSVHPDEASDALGAIDTDDRVALPGTGPIAVGALAFDPERPGMLTIPTRVVGTSADGTCWSTEIGPQPDAVQNAEPPPTRFTVAAVDDRDTWARAVRAALDAIATDELDKVVLSRAVTVDADRPFDRRAVLARLRAQQPGCIVYASDGLLGATPELLVRRTGVAVESRPLAGTTAGDGSDLTSSTKDGLEHRYVVDAIERALAPLCDRLDVPGTPHVLQLADIAHLATRIRGVLTAPAPSALAVARLLHPTPAVGGTPTQAALAAISRLERTPRGRYAGPVGWVDARGDGEWAVALRGAEIDGCRAVLRTGAGIVAGSDPELEWAETEAKLEPMLRALVRV